MKIEELLEAVAFGPRLPNAPFLIEELTFGQIYAQAEALKKALKKVGHTASPVCLCAEHRGFMAAAMLAALTSASPLLFPYAYNERTLLETWQNISFSHALVQGDYPLPHGVRAIPISGADPMPANPPLGEPMPVDATWLYLYTGGSTGTPRIWSKSPRNLLLEAANIAKFFRIQPEDRILSSVPPNHIYGLLYSVLLPLVSGASVSVRTPSYPNEIIQALDETKATVLVSIPAHYRALKTMSASRHRVHTAFSSAGALPEQDDRDFFKATGIAVIEVYGSTETGGIAYRRRCAGQTTLKPFSYVGIRIEGEQLRVGSDFLSAELSRDEEGLFLTADRVAACADGTGFEILGRNDGIIKVGGKRVDLTKIRQVIADIPEVKDVYVLATPVESGRGNEIIVLVAGCIDPDRIMQQAKAVLPAYALPRRIKVVDQIPLSATGKYNREAIENLINCSQANTAHPHDR